MSDEQECQRLKIEDVVLLGRATCMSSFQAPQIFGSFASNAGVPNTWVAQAPLGAVGWAQRVGRGQAGPIQSGRERLWRVRSSGLQVLRATGDSVTPLRREQITNPNQLPAAASRSPILALKKRIKIQGYTEETNITIDIGESIELYGFSVDIDLVGPPGTIVVSDGVSTSLTATATGLVFDAALGVEVLAIEAPLGKKRAKLTQHVPVLLNTQPTIAVPTAATEVKILQTTAGTASTSWNRFVGDPAVHASIQTGPITFTGRISDDRANELGNATHLQTDLDAVNDRFYTLIWTIEP